MITESLKNNATPSVAVRIFEDGEHRFVMFPEFLKVMKNLKIDIDLEILTAYGRVTEEIPTITYREIIEMYGSKISKVEFLIVPVRRAKHAAVPIITHDGDLCICAVDALWKILQDIIHVKKLFRRATSKDLNLIEEFINNVTEYFNGEDISPFFVGNKRLESLQKEYNAEFALLNLPENRTEIRRIPLSGFDVEDLQKELEHLKLPRFFPNITSYAKQAIDKLLESKFEEYLDTADLFKAVEYCQMACIFEHFPKLKDFLHSQKACHRVINVQCTECSVKKTKNKKTMWKEHVISEVVKVQFDLEKESLYDPIYKLADGSRFQTSNSSLSRETARKRIENFERKKKKPGNSNCNDATNELLEFSCIKESEAGPLLSGTINQMKLKEKLIEDRGQEHFLIHHKERKIYIRTILGTMMRHSDNKHVLTEEIIYNLPFILKQQDIFTYDNIRKLNVLTEKWKRAHDEERYSSINLKQLADIFDSFDIDKSKITLIPDGMSIIFVKNNVHGPFYINSNRGKLISSSHACFHIFKEYVSFADWKEVFHCGHETPIETCPCKVRNDILNLFEKWLDGDENLYRTKKEVDVSLDDVGRSYDRVLWKGDNRLNVSLKDQKPKVSVYMGILLEEEVLGITLEKFNSNKVKEAARRVKTERWRMAAVGLILSLTVFLGPKHTEFYNPLIKCITLMMPCIEFKTSEDIERFLAYGNDFKSMAKEEIDRRYESFKSRRSKNMLEATAEDVFLDVFENIKDGSLLQSVMKKTPNETLPQEELQNEEVLHNEDDTLENVEVVIENSGDEDERQQEPTTNRKNEVEWCKKCYRTSQLLSKMKGMYSVKKGEATELENAMKIVQQQLGEMKERENEVEAHFKRKYGNEMEEVKRKVENETLEAYKASVGVIRSENERLKTKLSELETINEVNEVELQRLRTENEKWTKDFGELARNIERNYQSEALREEDAMREEIKRLRAEVSNCKNQSSSGSHNSLHVPQKSHTVPLPASSSPSSSVSSSYSPSPPPVLPKPVQNSVIPNAELNVEKMLNYLKTQKHRVEGVKSISEASNIVKRIRVNTFENAVSERANKELQSFKMEHEAYLKALDENILLIEKNRQITRDQLISLPKEPTFSPWLMNKYKDVTENRNQRVPRKHLQANTHQNVQPPPRPPPDEISDRECLLCLEIAEIRGSIKCFSCSRRYHEDCISPWLRINSTCPTCRKGMLDPKEYPPLS